MSRRDMDVQWERLHQEAVAALRRPYVPYSGYPVGAAGMASDGTIYTGCNVENSSYGVGLCAECGMISDFVKGGGTRWFPAAGAASSSLSTGAMSFRLRCRAASCQ